MLASPSSSKQAVDVKEVREKQAISRSQLMRANAGYIPPFAVQQRRNFFSGKVKSNLHASSVAHWRVICKYSSFAISFPQHGCCCSCPEEHDKETSC